MEGLNLNSFQGGDSWDSTSKLIKEELLDDDYFKIPVPKVEPVFEQCEPTSSCSPPQKRRKYEQKLSWRQIIQSSVSNSDDSETQKRSKSEDQVQCRLCQQLNHSRQMKTFVSEMEKLLLMLAHLLNKTYSLEEAQSFILNVTNHHFICTIHFYESIDSIYSALDGRIVNGLFECSTEALEEFMITVNSLCHCMTPLKLCDVLYQFKLKNKWIPNTLPINTIYRQRHASSIVITENHEECCSFCHQSKKPEELKYVSLKTEKLVFMIASIIRNECTSLQGARFIYEKSEKAVCRDHFTEVILDIFAVPLEKVMRIVRSLGSKITPQEFKIALKYFILKNDGSSKESNPITQITKNDSIKLEVDDSIEETKFSHTEDFMKLSENRANRSNTPVEHLPARSISNGLPFQALIQQKHPVVRCSICSQIEESPNLTAISQNDKLILMVKSILCNENTVEQARQFMYDKNDHLICIRHLSETVRAIYKNLHISNYERMVSSSLDILMKIVESFRVILTLEDFLKVFKEFVSVNTITCTSNDLFNTANNLDSSASAPKYFPGRKRRTQCAICFQWIEWQFTKCLHLEDTKFVVIVACILSGRCTPEQAKTFVSNKDYRSVCISHFSDVFDEIQKCIGFGDMKDIFHCGDGPKRRIMTAVNSVAPMIKFTSFCETFLSFLNGNKKLMIAVFDSANCSERKDNIESTSSQVSAVKEEGTNGEIPNADPHQVVSDFGMTASEVPHGDFYRLCKVCSQWNHENKMRLSLLQIEKVVIMLGAVLTNTWRLESAAHFVKMKFIIQPNKLFKTMNFDSIQMNIKVRTVEVLLYETNGEQYQFVLNQSPVGDLFADIHVQKIMYKRQKYVMDEKCPNKYLLATENACLLIRKILLHENTKIKEFQIRFLKPAAVAKNNTLETHIRDYNEGVYPFFKFMVDNVFMYDRGPGKPSKENFRLNVEHLILRHNGKQENLMLWLPFLKEKVLKVIEIYNIMNEIPSEFTTVCATPQWLAAEEAYGWTQKPIQLPLEGYWNLKKFHFHFDVPTPKDLAHLVLHFTCHGNLIEGRMTIRGHENVFKGLWKSEDEKAQKEGEELPAILTYKWNCSDGNVLRATVGVDLVVFVKGPLAQVFPHYISQPTK